jgi:hypothetical protein
VLKGKRTFGTKSKNHYYIMEHIMSFIKNSDVVNAWKNNQPANGVSLSTDGTNLYSDRLIIGFTGGSSRTTKRVVDYQTVSKATTRHVNVAKSLGIKSVKPIGG